ncbi:MULTISPECIES: hypothetical protein [unclassified Frankia]|uniref:hypothetical protein n=1 Tax=unclassified Frankia TaxID=2632575 RepID=UPI002025A2E6
MTRSTTSPSPNEQDEELGYLVGLGFHVVLAEHGTPVVVEGGEQVPCIGRATA